MGPGKNGTACFNPTCCWQANYPTTNIRLAGPDLRCILHDRVHATGHPCSRRMPQRDVVRYDLLILDQGLAPSGQRQFCILQITALVSITFSCQRRQAKQHHVLEWEVP